ncbi:hypothetical protein BO82DRAFT_6032 [Aspergillus uvarum CBS 121591]|uniref:Uncharacterized protein n=1 Tax=Aspergillus uvarum CBS 121591 TaxID=1448315 RepID=A0A319CXV8_9EURO|nr:hypothetical protein BO82DRAFT_6032 [Aspergillus uvarum CBS 121591]PYH87257.1 hypothetical protein BO82DRAFT_6032 [Aspergillus uvarum CBS 121591]
MNKVDPLELHTRHIPIVIVSTMCSTRNRDPLSAPIAQNPRQSRRVHTPYHTQSHCSRNSTTSNHSDYHSIRQSTAKNHGSNFKDPSHCI